MRQLWSPMYQEAPDPNSFISGVLKKCVDTGKVLVMSYTRQLSRRVKHVFFFFWAAPAYLSRCLTSNIQS